MIHTKVRVSSLMLWLFILHGIVACHFLLLKVLESCLVYRSSDLEILTLTLLLQGHLYIIRVAEENLGFCDGDVSRVTHATA